MDDEILARYRRDMGDGLGRVYNELSNGLSRLQVKWNLYKQLYMHSSERVELIQGSRVVL